MSVCFGLLPRSELTSVKMQQESASENHEFIEGVRLKIQPSPVGRRIVAAIVDMGIVSGILSLAMIPLAFIAVVLGIVLAMTGVVGYMKEQMPILGLALLFIAALLVVLVLLGLMHFYYIYYEYKRGATPGKKLLGLRVVSVDGKRLTRGQAVYRDLVRWYVDSLLILPALIAMYSTEKRQRVGDILAGTVVVYSRTSEDSDRALYVKREDYQALFAHLQPKPVPAELRSRYLEFANKAFLLGQESELTNERVVWLVEVRRHLEKSETLGLNDLTVLRFFAEFCFQTEFETRALRKS